MQQVRDTCAEDRKAHANFKRSNIRPRVDDPPSISDACRTGIRDLARSTMFALDDETNMQMIPANADNPTNLETHPDGAAVPDIDIDGLNAVVQLARQYQDRRGAENRPGVNRMYQAMMVATLVLRYVQEVSLVINEVQDLMKIIEWSVETIKKVTLKDAVCSDELICFADDCKGYEANRFLEDLESEPELKQTGLCAEVRNPVALEETGLTILQQSNKGCHCEYLPQPFVRTVSNDYFDSMQQFMDDIEDDISQPHCNTDDPLNFDTARFDEAISSACHDHNELRRKKRHGAAIKKRDDGFTYQNIDKDNLRWKLSWDNNSGKCGLKCEDVFKQMLYYEKCKLLP
jgi:hypothetical protein